MSLSFSVREAKIEALAQQMRELNIEEKDLHEQFVRASGPGGQHVNKTSTAVRLTHVPTGIDVRVSSTRSQAHNRFLARRQLCEEILRTLGVKSSSEKKAAKKKKQKARRRRRSPSKSDS